MGSKTDRPTVRWNERDIDAVPPPPPGKRSIHHHPSRRGLVLVTTAAGTKTYFVQRRVNGQPRRVFVGRFPDMAPSAAVKAAGPINAAIDQGTDPSLERRDRTAAATLGKYWSDYFEPGHVQIRLKAATAYQYRLTWREYIAPTLGHLKLQDVSKARIRRMHEYLAADGKHRTGNVALAIIHCVLQHAIDGEAMPGPNPARGIKKHPEIERDRFLSREEIARLWSVLDKDVAEHGPDTADLVRLLLLTGARRGNVLSMRWQDVDLLARRWTIPAATTKTGRQYRVMLAPGAVDVLIRRRQTREDSPFVFPTRRTGSRGTPHMGDPRAAWQRIREAAGLQDVRLHDLRHTHASLMANEGVSLLEIGAQLGHRSARTTQRYAHLLADRIQESVDRAMEGVGLIEGAE